MRALEPRILLDAAAVETAIDTVGEAVHSTLADAYLAPHFSGQSQSDDTPNQQSPTAENEPFPEDVELPGQTNQSTHIAFVAADVPDVLTLVAALPADAEIVMLDASGDEIGQIAQALAGRSGIEAIHLISHGDAGILKFGGSSVDVHSMSQIQRQQFAMIGNALTEDGDILVYACDFAEGDKGQDAVDLLADLTGADIAASTDTTGHASLGGDWDLEYKTGAIEAEVFNAGDAWLGALAPVVHESYEIDFSDIDHDERIGSDRSNGQIFNHVSAGSTYTMDQLDLVLRIDGAPPLQEVMVTIRERGPVGSPGTGAIIGTGSLSSVGILSTYSWQSILLDAPVVLNSGQDYVFMVETNESSSGSDSVQMGVQHDGGYSNGNAIDRNGEIRETPPLYDSTPFRVIGDDNAAPDIDTSLLEDVAGLRLLFPNENVTDVATITATDADPGDTLTFSIVSDADFQTQYPGYPSYFSEDASLFSIEPVTGVLSFITPPDFEAPTDADPNGTYWVTVAVSDGKGGMDILPIGITVGDVNDAPVATGGQMVTTAEDTPVLIPNSAFPYDDDEGDTANGITISGLPLTGGTLTHSSGTVIVANNMPLSASEMADLTFIPDPDFNGTLTFNYTSNDADAGTVAADVTINVTPVNDAPVATGGTGTTLEDTPYYFDGTEFGFTDVEGDPLSSVTITSLSLDGGVLYRTNGGWIINTGMTVVQAHLDKLAFIPASNSTSSITIEYLANDADPGTVPSVITIGVTPVNNAPVASNDSLNVQEDTPILLNPSSPTDVDDALANLTITVDQAPTAAQGTLTYTLDGGGTGMAIVATTLSATEFASLVFTPVTSYTGSVDDVVYTVTDDDGLSDAGSVGTIALNINGINDAPDAFDNTLTVNEDTATLLNATMPSDVDDAVADLTVTINQTPSAAQGVLTYTFDGGGTGNADVGAILSTSEFATLTFTPVLNYTGPVNDLIYRVADDEGASDAGSNGSVAFVINPMNDAPVGTTVPLTTVEEMPVSGMVTMSDPDTGDTPEATLGTAPSNGSVVVNPDGTFIYTPDADYTGSDGFTIMVTDDSGLTDTVTVNVTVTPVNDAPVGTALPITTPEDTAVGGVVTMGDPDTGDTPEATPGTAPSNGSVVVNPDGTFIYTPDADYTGSDGFTIMVTDDSGLTDTVTVNVTVTPVNDAPVGTALPVTTPEDTAVGGVVTMDDPDTGDTPEATLGTGPTNGSVIVNLDGTYIYTPDPDYVGPDSFTVVVTDDAGLTDTVAVNVTATSVNEAPVGFASAVTTFEDTSLTGAITMSDPDANDTPEASLGTGPSNGSVIVNPNGTFTYTPASDFEGADSFTIIVTDDAGLTDIVTVNVTVAPVDDGVTVTDPDDPVIPDTTSPEPQPTDEEADDPEEELDPVKLDGGSISTTPPPLIPEPPASTAKPPVKAAPVAPAAVVVDVPEQLPVNPDDVKTKVEISAPAVPKNTAPSYDFAKVDAQALSKDLARTTDEVRKYDEFLGTGAAKVTFAFSSLLSVGGVSFVLRGGAIAAALVSAVPAWGRFDPIAIVTGRKDENEEDDEEDVDMMLDFVSDARSRVDKESFL